MSYPDNEPEIIAPQSLDQSSKEKLKLYISKIENLEAEKQDIIAQIKDVKADAKALGFDVTAINGVVKYRKIDRRKREERQMMLDLYLHAVGEI